MNYLLHPINYIVFKSKKNFALTFNLLFILILYTLCSDINKLSGQTFYFSITSIVTYLFVVICHNFFYWRVKFDFRGVRYDVKIKRFITFDESWRISAYNFYIDHISSFLDKKLENMDSLLSRKIKEEGIQIKIQSLIGLAQIENWIGNTKSNIYVLRLISYSFRVSLLAQMEKLQSMYDTLSKEQQRRVIEQLFNPYNLVWIENQGIKYDENRLSKKIDEIIRHKDTTTNKYTQDKAISELKECILSTSNNITNQISQNIDSYSTLVIKSLEGKHLTFDLTNQYRQSNLRDDLMGCLNEAIQENKVKKKEAKLMADAFIVKHTKNKNGNKTISSDYKDIISLDCFNHEKLIKIIKIRLKKKQINSTINQFEAILNLYFSNIK